MSELIAIAYPDEQRATQVLDAIKQLESDGAIDLESGIALIKDRDGHVAVENAAGSSIGKGAAGGLLLGTIAGMILLAPLAGAIFGVAGGTLVGAFADVSHISDFQSQVADNMPPGSSAVLVLAKMNDPEKGLALLRQYGGRLIRTTLPDNAEARIQAALASGGAG